MKDIVIIDLETTGTDPKFDKIIEVGAVKVKNLEIVDEYCSFVNPKRKLSQEITNITGIKDDDLKDAPSIEEVLSELDQFLNGDPLLAHNMDFDRSFLEKNGVEGRFLDSLDLACMLYPRENKHTQEHLLEKLCGTTYDAHRALEDVKNLFTLYKKLLERGKEMDDRVKNEIRDALKSTDWEFKQLFEGSSTGDSYLTEEAEHNKFCPKNLPKKASGIPMAHLMSWLFYTETGNMSELSYWVRRKYESFFGEVRVRKCKDKCNYFNQNERLF
ncbi:MAG: 3'-5' exonuclease [Patescibacteria group bacterium]